MKLHPAIALILAITPSLALAETTVRARITDFTPYSSSQPTSSLDALDSVAPDVSVSWSLDASSAIDVSLPVPSRLKFAEAGEDLGAAQWIPVAATLQYRWPARSNVRPYVGGGMNYTRFVERRLHEGRELERDSTGAVVQGGIDVVFGRSWFLNVDVKKLWISADISDLSGETRRVDINPLMVGFGGGWRF